MKTSTHELLERCPRCHQPFMLITHEIPTVGETIKQYVVECSANSSHQPTATLDQRIGRLNAEFS